MAAVVIADVATANPPHRLIQAEAIDRVGAAAGAPRIVGALARGTMIEGRWLALTAAEVAALGTIESRNRIYARIAPELGAQAAGQVLAAGDGGCRFFVVSSCTGHVVPGIDVLMAEKLGLDCDTARLPVTEAGCAGGVVALARAADFLRNRPGAVAIAAAVEICSLAFHADTEEGNLVSSLIFADGAGAARLESRLPVADDLEIVDNASFLIPGSRDAIGFDLTDRGFYPRLTREVAAILPEPAGRLVTRLLARHSLTPSDLSFWLLHPGGPRILEAIEDSLAIDRERMRWSWQSLRECGNLSSVAVFDVLRRFRADETAPGGWGVVIAFGPGVSIEALLVRRAGAGA